MTKAGSIFYGLVLFVMLQVTFTSPYCEHRAWWDKALISVGWPVVASFVLAESLTKPRKIEPYHACWKPKEPSQ